MTKGPRRPMAHTPSSPGPVLDREATRRARMSVSALGDVLPQAAVSSLAREVISRLAERGANQSASHVLAANLADALVSRDEGAGLRLVRRAISSGISVEELYLTYLTGAARLLGTRWGDGGLNAAQVTIAAARIYAIMRGLSPQLTPDTWPDGHHAVFATVPGEQHTLGITMAADLFRREGWQIDLKVGRQHNELLSELAQMDFAIIGLSATTEAVLPELIRLIAAIRVSHPHARIIVSGTLAATDPRLRQVTDADYVSTKLDTLRAVMRDFADEMTAPSRKGAARG